MNRIYKVIWSKVKHQYVVVSELAHSCTKSAGSRVGRSAAAVLAALVLTTGLCAAPVQAEDLTDPYVLVNDRVKETNSTSSDKLVALVQSPLAKSVAPLANEDEEQPGEGGDTSGTTPTDPATESTKQHTIINEDGFYAYNGEERNTYNSLNKDGLWVGGTDDNTGFHVDNDGNVETTGDVSIGGDLTVTNKIQGGTFANTDNSFSVDADGDVTAKDVTASGALKGDSAAITNDATVGGKLSVTGSVTGGTFANADNSFSVNANGNVTAADFTAGNINVDGTNNIVKGLSNTKWDDSTIQSVTNDIDRTGAAAYAATQGQLYDVYNAAVENAKGTQYTAGDGIAIGTGDTPAISVNYGAGLELGEAAGEGTKPLQVNANEKKGIEVTDDGVGIKLAESGSNLTFDSNGGLTLADTLTGLTSVTAGSGSFTSKLTVGSNDSVITIENGTISGLADITESSSGDVAVNKNYVDSLIKDITVEGTEYTQGDGVSIAKGANEGDPSTISVNAGDGLTFSEQADENGTKKLVVNAGNGLGINDDGSVEVQTGNGLKVNEDTNAVELVVDDTNLQIDGMKRLGLKSDITVNRATATTFAIASSNVALNASGLTVNDTTRLTVDDGLKATKASIDNISIDGSLITGVTTNGQEGTSAVSVDYLKG